MHSLAQDFRFALRMLAKNRSFTVVALLTLALGIGATSAMFTVVNGVLLKPFLFSDSDRIVMLYETLPQGGTGSVSVPNFIDWRAQANSFEQLASATYASVNLQREGQAERVRAIAGTSNYFEVFKVTPLLGRTFVAGEDSKGHDHVVVLSDAIWKSHFGGDTKIVGTTIPLDGEPYTVIGVVPMTSRNGQVYLPLTFNAQQLQNRGSHWMAVAGKLKQGVTVENALQEMRVIAARLEAQYPEHQSKRSVAILPYKEAAVGYIRPALIILFVAVLFVLVIACINVINLMLARAAARRKEIAIRTALGAGRVRLLRQFLTESAILALAAAFLGLELAQLSLKVLVSMASAYLPRASEIALDWRVFSFAMLTALGCAVAIGLAPLFQIGKGDVHDRLKEGSSTASPTTNRVRSVLAVGQIAAAVVLLIGAGLLLASLYRLNQVQPGLNADNVLTFKVQLSGNYDTVEKTQQFYSAVQERVGALPGVQSVAMISMLPIERYGANGNVEIVGLPYNDVYQSPLVEMRLVSPHYFETLSIPMIAGRDFAPTDRADSQKVVLVNETFARVFFGGESPLGRIVGKDAKTGSVIVGVAKDVRQTGLARDPMPELYMPYSQILSGAASVVVKTTADPMSVVPAIREQVKVIDSTQALYDIDRLDTVIARSLSNNRLNATLMSIFAGVATILAAIGIFGVMSYLVTQHTREIGIRMALGAQRVDVLRMVVGQGMTLTVIALVIGSLAAMATSRALAGLLFGIKPIHAGVYVTVELGLLLVALAACLIPALRATKVDPMIALRQAE
jgi:putative ABC transport system permease protein